MRAGPETADPERPRGTKLKLFNRLGSVVALVAIAWVFWQISRQGWVLPVGSARRSLLVAIGVGVLAYGLLSLLMATAWWWLTGIYAFRRSLLATGAVWARTQLAKYLPSNLLHYVGRQLMGRRIGLRHEALLAANLLELVSILAAAGLIGAAGAIVSRSPVAAELSLPMLGAVLLLGLLIWPVADKVLRRLPYTASRMALLPRLSVGSVLRLMAPAFLLHGLFLIGTGLVLMALVRAGWPEQSVDGMDVVWIYALAWAAGTLTPGAPGGLGVREGIVTIGLQGTLGEAESAMLALSLRMVTLLGDVLVFGLGWAVGIADTDDSTRSSLPSAMGGDPK